MHEADAKLPPAFDEKPHEGKLTNSTLQRDFEPETDGVRSSISIPDPIPGSVWICIGMKYIGYLHGQIRTYMIFKEILYEIFKIR